MNIFILDEHPVTAAKYYCDKHVPKMCVELYQQLGSAVIRHGATPDQMPLTSKGTPLKGGYHNHPCTRWCGDSRINFMWASTHAIALCEEYTKRFGKVHSCENGIRQLADMQYMIQGTKLTKNSLAMPDKYKSENAIYSYRQYYIHEKSHFAKWERGRSAPLWFIEGVSHSSSNYQKPIVV